MVVRRISCHVVIVASFALIAFSLAEWQLSGFTLETLWPLHGEMRLHPAHVLILGVAILPPAVWELFALDHREKHARD